MTAIKLALFSYTVHACVILKGEEEETEGRRGKVKRLFSDKEVSEHAGHNHSKAASSPFASDHVNTEELIK